jgi:hypothetical protein
MNEEQPTSKRKRVARFKVFAQLDGAGGAQHGMVEIDRDSGEMSVRVKRKRRRYTMPLSYVASMMVKAIIMYEIREKRAAKKGAKKRA